jgi:hypothetical protein
MSQQDLVDAVRAEVESVPARSGDLESVIRKGKTRRRVFQIGSWSLAVAMSAVIFGIPLMINPSPSSFASDGSLELLPGFDVPVTGTPIESSGALIYAAEPGPATSPVVDVAQFGTEVTISPADPQDFVVPISDNPGNALQADRVVYLGDLGAAQLALHRFDDQLMVYLGNGTQVAGGGISVTCDGLAGGDFVDPAVGRWLAWTRLPEATAMVAAETSDGERYWQRPIGRTVVFILPDGTTVDPSTLSALNAEGDEIATTRGLDLALGEIGFPPVDEQPPEAQPEKDC